jgi:Zn-dependent peptidase ImmA (M78 family)
VGEGRALEREANVFAAELLMPEELVRRLGGSNTREVAATFKVSEEAMSWRLYNLGLSERPPRVIKASIGPELPEP